MVDDLADRRAARHGHDLRHVHHRVSADRDDAVVVERLRILDDRVDHHVGRLLIAVLVDEQYVRAVEMGLEERVVDHADGGYQGAPRT